MPSYKKYEEDEYTPHIPDAPTPQTNAFIRQVWRSTIITILVISIIVVFHNIFVNNPLPSINFPTPIVRVSTAPPQVRNLIAPKGTAFIGNWGPIPGDWNYSFLRIDGKAHTVTGTCHPGNVTRPAVTGTNQ